jgi:hypothetical protein
MLLIFSSTGQRSEFSILESREAYLVCFIESIFGIENGSHPSSELAEPYIRVSVEPW